MPKAKGLWNVVAAAAVGMSVSSVVQGQTTCNRMVGPDVIVGELTRESNTIGTGACTSTSWSATVNGVPTSAFSLGTYSCNPGSVDVNWLTASNTGNPNENRHPVIGQNLYRLRTVNGAARFEQLGQSWLKHGFYALSNTLCCTVCHGNTNGLHLGVGCSDPYTASRNAGQSSLGPKWQVNASTGVFAYPPANPPGGTSTAIARRCHCAASELDTTSSFFWEGQYVTQDDAAAGNKNNNCSYRPVHFVAGTNPLWTMYIDHTTVRETPAIHAWKDTDPTVTESGLQVPSEGYYIISSKATNLGNGMWHYEYAVFNMNSDLSGGSFSVPVPDGATVTNIGFHDVDYSDGDGIGNVNIDGTDWPATRANNTITWATTPFASNANGNAIRWATLYNFRFDSDAAPATGGQATLGMWKSSDAYSVAAQVPAVPCYANCDGSTSAPVLNVNDFVCFMARFSAGDSYANCDGSTDVPVLNVNDFACFMNAFASGCH